MARRRSRVRTPRNPFPSVRYGPQGAVQTFDREEDVPEGWHDHPSMVQDKPEAPKTPATDGEKQPVPIVPVEDSQGDPWVPHAEALLEDEEDDLPPETKEPKKLRKQRR